MRNHVKVTTKSTIKTKPAPNGRTKVFRRGDNRLLGAIIGEQFKVDEKNRRLYKSDMLDILSEMKNIRDKHEISELGGDVIGNILKWMIDYLAEITNFRISVIRDDAEKDFISLLIFMLPHGEKGSPLFLAEFKKKKPKEIKMEFYDAIPNETINTVVEGIKLITQLVKTERFKEHRSFAKKG